VSAVRMTDPLSSRLQVKTGSETWQHKRSGREDMQVAAAQAQGARGLRMHAPRGVRVVGEDGTVEDPVAVLPVLAVRVRLQQTKGGQVHQSDYGAAAQRRRLQPVSLTLCIQPTSESSELRIRACRAGPDMRGVRA
jgi:hypothetical protein